MPTPEPNAAIEAGAATAGGSFIKKSDPVQNQNGSLGWGVVAVLALLIIVGLGFRASHLDRKSVV